MAGAEERIGFFDLARELRDNIYDHAGETREEKFHGDLKAIATKVPPISLLLVSKQVRKECSERLMPQAAIQVYEYNWTESRHLKIPPALATIRAVELNARVLHTLGVTSDSTSECACAEWVWCLISQLPQANSITINIMDWDDDWDEWDDEYFGSHESMLEKLLFFCRQVRLSKDVKFLGYRGWSYLNDRRPEVEYDPASEKFELVDADEPEESESERALTEDRIAALEAARLAAGP